MKNNQANLKNQTKQKHMQAMHNRGPIHSRGKKELY